MNVRLLFALLAGCICVLSGCKPQKQHLIGGKGGNATLRIFTYHHVLIDTATVYLKYDAWEMPGSFDESMKVVKTPGNDTAFATFTGLKPGDYFFYAIDDSLKALPSKGGYHIEITDEKVYKLNCILTHH